MISADLINKGHALLAGRQIAGSEDLASLAQVYRDPLSRGWSRSALPRRLGLKDGTDSPDKLNKTTLSDLAATAAELAGDAAALTGIPVIGTIIGRVIGSLIPGQRIDRIQDLMERLAQKVEDINQESLRAKMQSPEGVDLLEDAFLQTARAMTEERREAISTLLASGFTADELKHAELKKLLWLLSELSDPELVWLIYLGSDYDEELGEVHADVLGYRLTSTQSTEEEFDAAALQASWRRRLIDLGLVKNRKFSEGFVDLAFSGLKHSTEEGSLAVTQLGSLLLGSIGVNCIAY